MPYFLATQSNLVTLLLQKSQTYPTFATGTFGVAQQRSTQAPRTTTSTTYYKHRLTPNCQHKLRKQPRDFIPNEFTLEYYRWTYRQNIQPVDTSYLKIQQDSRWSTHSEANPKASDLLRRIELTVHYSHGFKYCVHI